MKTLRLDRVTMTYPGGTSPVIDRLSLDVPAGGLTALLGPSGSGKSTLLKLIAGLASPDFGDILLDGVSILRKPPDRRGVVMVFQNAPLFPHLTLAENVGFGLRMRGIAGAEVAGRVTAMLDRVQLGGLQARRPHELSGGQAQRGALARALVLRPEVLLLDEPLSNLDAGLRDEMRVLIRSLQRETGVTMLVVTHDQAEAVALADRVALMLGGRLAQEATPWDIYRRPASLAVAQFFGGVNFLPGRSESGTFVCALGRLPLSDGLAPGPGILSIRPEAIRLGPGPKAHSGQVLGLMFLGTQARVELVVNGTRLEALTPPETAAALSIGGTVGVTFPVEAMWIVPDDAREVPG